MVLFKRKQVQYIERPSFLPDDVEIWTIEETDEMFTTYEAYLKRNDFYRLRRFICEITGHSGLTFREALRSEKEASGEVEDAFPEPLREPILRKVQFCPIQRIDHLVDWIYEVFKRDFYPGESIAIVLDDERFSGQIKAKSRFPELLRADGSIERPSFSRYFCHIDQRPGQEALLDDHHVQRERKVFTKQRIRSYLKNAATREAWNGAPWLVKPKLAEDYRIPTEIPPHLTQEYQARVRKTANVNGKKSEHDGPFLSFQAYGPQGGPQYQPLKPRGKKSSAKDEQHYMQFAQYLQTHQPTAGMPVHLPPEFQGYQHIQPMVNGFNPIAPKGQPKSAAPAPPKYPIEDLEIPPTRDGTHRPALKYLSEQTPTDDQDSTGAGNGISMESVGSLLETWNTLNVYCEVFQLDSFTFDDFIEALQFSSAEVQCELLVEIHCAVLKKLVNDVNDKNGQVQITLPDQAESEDDDSSTADSHQASPAPEPEPVKPPARSTRSSLVKSEAAELRKATNGLSLNDIKLHKAAEMDRSVRGYDWKMRLRKRDFQDGRWVIILVGLLNQLAGNARLTDSCNELLTHLAPLNGEATAETASAQYQTLDINLRIKILQIICMKSLETKVIKQYMEDCSLQMTEHRKEKNDVKRNWRVAVEDLRQLHEERKALQPEDKSASPPLELEEIKESKMELDELDDEEEEEEAVVSDSAAETEEEAPHQGRSLRRANDRAAARKKKAEEEKERKAAAAAEKAKKPSKEEKKYEKLLTKIENAKDRVKEYEEEIATVENDLRENDCPRTKCLGKDRFWNRYYWMERNAMPYAGLPDSSTAHAGYANGCVWVQGPDDLERTGFIELSPEENAQYERAFQMTVPTRKLVEEGDTHVFSARQWGYYDDPDALDMLIGWLDARGVREMKLRKELSLQREKISVHMQKRHEYLSSDDDTKPESSEPATRVSTRTKTYVDPTGHRCLAWKNTTAINELGHLHSEAKPPTYKKQRGVAVKKSQIIEAEEEPAPRQTRGSNRQVSGTRKGTARTNGRQPTRQGSRYDF